MVPFQLTEPISDPLRDFRAWEGGRVTCLFLVDTRFTGDPVGCGHQDPQSATCPLLSGCLGVWCWMGGTVAEGAKRPGGGCGRMLPTE